VRTSLLLPLLALLASGCAALGQGKDDRRSLASLEQVRAGAQAACGQVSGIGGDPWSADRKRQPEGGVISEKLAPSSAEACARFDAAGREEAGEGAVLAVKLAFAEGDDRWMPAHWHVEVIDHRGMVVQAGMLGEGRSERGSCVLGVCTMEGYASVPLPEPWRMGRYKIRLTHVPTRKRVDLSFDLG
jgi:hypothetical protein